VRAATERKTKYPVRRRTRAECGGLCSRPIEEMLGGTREKTPAVTDPVFAVRQCDGNLCQGELPSFRDCVASGYTKGSETSVPQLPRDLRISSTEGHPFCRQPARLTRGVNFLAAGGGACPLVDFQTRQQPRYHVEKLFTFGYDFKKRSFQQLLI